jgi:transposase
MPVRNFSRQQTWLLPPTLDELLPADHPARFVAMVVDSLETNFWQRLHILLEGDPLGAPSYHPRAMLGVWLYGFMTRTRTSRKLEAACRDQIPYLWLTGWQHPDHNSLWRFYRACRKEMHRLFKLTIKTAVKMELVDLAVQAVDGSKLAGNAATGRTYDQKGLEKLLERTEKVIADLEKENEAGTDPAPVHLPEKLRKAEQLKTAVKTALAVLAADEGRKKINLTDEETQLMKTRQGVVAGYNLEGVVSPLKDSQVEKPGNLLTAVEVVRATTDTQQLVPMLEQAEENCGKKAATSLADAGFHSGKNLAACEKREQVIVMAESQEKALKRLYHKDCFVYDPKSDNYLCPGGHILQFINTRLVRHTLMRIYRGGQGVCRKCPAFGTCTTNKHHGRELQVGENEAALRRHREWMQTAEAKIVYRRRKELIEPTFGIIKEQMGIRRFWLRGLKNVRAEAMVLATAFNLRTLYKVWQGRSIAKRQAFSDCLQASWLVSRERALCLG